jgi:hypothetical protein
VTDRVLDQRLHDQGRHAPLAEALRHRDDVAELRVEAQLAELQVALEEVDLLRERDVEALAAAHRHAQQLAEAADRVERAVALADLHEARDRVQAVEQEMRVDLRLQRQQPRFGELHLEPRAAQLSLRRVPQRLQPQAMDSARRRTR